MYNILGELKSIENNLRTFTEQELNLIVDVLSLEFVPKKKIAVEIKNREDLKINQDWYRENSWIIEYRFTKRKDIHRKEIVRNIEYYSDIIYNIIYTFDSTIPYYLVKKSINRQYKNGNKFSVKRTNNKRDNT